MLFYLTATILSLLFSQAIAISPRESAASYSNLNTFIASERRIALQGVLNNIGPDGSKVAGAGNYVVASPSKTNPDYFYTWTRDSALTLKMIVDEFIFGNRALQPQIEKYVKAQAILQTVTNPSGPLLNHGLGLGEPKYEVDGTRFNGTWGRPQRDGPALRAIALIAYSNWLVNHNQLQRAKLVIWPIISNDLSYVAQYWNQTGYDLWEEVYGSDFFTFQNSHRALIEGQILAFVTMAQRRSGQYPPSWGSSASLAPPNCGPTSYDGSYAPAIAAGAPNITAPCQQYVQFNVNATTYFGESIYVVGNITDLGSWDLNKALPLGAGQYTAEWPLWSLDTELLADSTISYAYVRVQDCGQAPIYESRNRTLVTGDCRGGGLKVVRDKWTGDVGTSGGC
ncbi:hypothetical protein DID88_010464 [Monilinia fructigena]|uniref:glucan 1,4-alpha-glucosidase n=1 Tax=Monilinia fructigena TaxID=38457 RepID=A0A395ILG9_9HELO|nr:hypothetical protein DID88_010464 [Monilinia fructigena]